MRVPLSVDPNNKHWTSDSSRFGYQMLLKMGWSEGKGLGRQEQGNPDFIRVQKREPNQGLSSEEDQSPLCRKYVNWTVHKSNFDDLLRKMSSGEAGRTRRSEEGAKSKRKRNSEDSDSSGAASEALQLDESRCEIV
eukprot:RCo040982